LKICSICRKISGSGQDHLDCIERRRIELEDEELKRNIPEKLDLAKDPGDLGKELKAILGHLTGTKSDS